MNPFKRAHTVLTSVALLLTLGLTACEQQDFLGPEVTTSETLVTSAANSPGFSFFFVDFDGGVPSAIANNGDEINIGLGGTGSFSFHPKTVSGGGSFTITGAAGADSGTWEATKLVSFHSYGLSTGDPDLPVDPVWGGFLILEIELTGSAGTHTGILKLTCADFGNPPPGAHQGMTLQIVGGQHFEGVWTFDPDPVGPTQGASFFVETP